MNWKTVESERSAAKSSTRVPTAWKASRQSSTAVSLETRSPTPDHHSIGGASRQTSVSTTTPYGMQEGNDRRLPSSVRLDCGLQKPSFERDAGTEK